MKCGDCLNSCPGNEPDCMAFDLVESLRGDVREFKAAIQAADALVKFCSEGFDTELREDLDELHTLIDAYKRARP